MTRHLLTLAIAVCSLIGVPLLAAPSNDNFADAVVLSGTSGSTAGTNVGATGQAGEPYGHYHSNSVWYRWTPAVSGLVVFRTNGSDFDTMLAVYRGGSLGALTCLGANDDDGYSLASRVSFTATAGTTYQVAVGGWGGSRGNIVLNWSLTPGAIPPVIIGPASATGRVGEPLAMTVAASNDPHLFSASGFPPGLAMDPATGAISGRPLQAGNFTVPVTATNSAGTGSGSISFSIAKGRVAIRWATLTAVYDGTAKEASVTTVPAGLGVTLAYAGGSPPTAAGNHPVQATVNDANYEGTASATLTIAKAPATVSLADLSSTYDGTPKAATATTLPAGLAVNLTYDGRTTPPVEPGSYTVVATVNDPNHAGTATGTVVVSKRSATVVIGGLNRSYTGSAQGATATTTPPGLQVVFTYAGNPSAPVAAGSYPVVATIQDARYQGSSNATLTIAKVPAGVLLGSLEQAYDGSPKSPTATTTPAGLGVSFTFGGSPTPPTAVGSYPVTATITSPNHSGSASGTFVITKRAATISFTGLSQVYDGTSRPVTVTTTPPGLHVTLQYPYGTPPVAAGSYQVWASVQDVNYQASSSAILVVAKAPAAIQLGGLQTVYDGSAKVPVVTTVPAGLKVDTYFTFTGNKPPVTAGNYTVYASIDDPNYIGFTSAPMVIAKAPATVTLTNLSATYDGQRKVATAITQPAGVFVQVRYNGNQLGPIEAGSYPVTATISHTNYTGNTTGTLTISKATAAVTLSGLNATYSGAQKEVSATTVPPGLDYAVTYNGGPTAPSALGSYAVNVTVNDANYTGGASDTLVIRKPMATMTLANLAQVYDGSPRPVTVVTQPGGLASVVTYNGSTTPPVAEGNYAVTATLNEPEYEPASVSGTLIISAFPEPWVFTTLAGTNTSGRVDGSGNEARFDGPWGVAVATDGTVYVADTDNHSIRKITPDGVTSHFAGSPTGSPGSNDGTGAEARFSSPRGLAIDPSGNLWVADSSNHVIRKVTPTGVVTTVAGLAGTLGNTNGNGTTARFRSPFYLASDADGNLYVSDTGNHVIRKVTPAGDVTTLAGLAGSQGTTDGTGSAARFRSPYGITVHAETGTIYVAENTNRTIRAITPAGVVSTFAGLAGSSGTVNGVGSAARFSFPTGLAADADGNLFVCDGAMIRKVSFEGEVSSLAGSPTASGYVDGNGSSARFNYPAGIALGTNGHLFFSENNNHTIRRGAPAMRTGPPEIINPATFSGTLNSAWPSFVISATGGPTSYTVTGLPPGLSLSPATGVISGTPTVPGSYTVTLGATNGSGTTTRTITLVVQKISASVFLSGMTVTYDGNPKSITTTTVPAGLPLSITYNGSTTVPSAVGSYAMIATVNDPVYRGTASGTFSIVKPIATLALSNLRPVFTGNPLPVTVTTTPPGLAVSVTYNGSPVVPSAPGAYAVVATLLDDYYQPASATGTMEVSRYATPYTFTTLAGRAGGPGSEDGPRTTARFKKPAGIARDSAGNLFVADTDNHTIRKIATDGTVTTVAGTAGSSGSADGLGLVARFSSPRGIVATSGGILYVADTGNSTIRKIAVDGTVTTLAGSAGQTGTTNGTGSVARFNAPAGLAVSSAGEIYVADTENHAIRKVTTAGVVTTFAGTVGTFGSTNATGTAAQFKRPTSLTFDSSGNLFVVDRGNCRIRKVTSAAVVTTLAGNYSDHGDGTGTAAYFTDPCGIAADPSGNFIVTEDLSNVVRKVTAAGVVTTVAGTVNSIGQADGTGSAARFTRLAGVVVDAAGTAFVVDTDNHAIRAVTPAGVVTTYAGRYYYGSTDGNAIDARFWAPEGMAVDTAGNRYVADNDNRTIRKITPAGVVSTLAGLAGVSGSTDGTGSAARFISPRAIALDASGNLFVSDSGRIRKVTPDGVVTTFATDLGGQFNPTGIAFDSAGNLVVANMGTLYEIYKFAPDGQRITFMSTSTLISSLNLASAGTYDLSGMAIDGGDNVYLVASGYQVVIKITPAGVASIHAGTPGVPGSADGIGTAARFNFYTGFAYFGGIAADDAGNLFVADSQNQTIRHITPEGEVTTLAGKPRVVGFADGIGEEALFWNPGGIALDTDGSLLVSTESTNTIRRGSANPAVPVITSVTSASGRVGVPFSYRITASGAATSYSATGLPTGLSCNPTTGLITGTPGQFGTFAVTLNVQSSAGSGSAVLQLLVLKPLATLTLGGLAQDFDGQPRPVTATTTPADLAVAITYNGSPTAPWAPGSYEVVAAITDPGYEAEEARGTLVISTSLRAYTFTTLAGVPTAAGSIDGTGSAGRFSSPRGLAVNAEGDLFVADVGNSTIRKITPAGVVTTLAGSPGLAGSADGQGSAARFQHPHAVTVDGSGNVYVADTNNCTVRKITPGGLVTTLAGSAGFPGSNDGTGTSARFTDLHGIAVTPTGTVYVADTSNGTIRKITPAGVVTTFAGTAGQFGHTDGTGAAARFGGVTSLAIDRSGNLYAADLSNNVIRKITPEAVVTTFAGALGAIGTADGTGSTARFYGPIAVTVDAGGNVYVADFNNGRIRKITAAGVVTTMAGYDPYHGSRDGTGFGAYFREPIGIAVDAAGIVYVADQEDHTIRSGHLETGEPAPEITGAVAATGTFGQPFADYSVVASGAPFSYAASSLPPGLSIHPETGVISGTPTAAGEFSVTLSATNASGTGTATVVFTIAKKQAEIELDTLAQRYDGSPHAATATTMPAGLPVTITYNGGAALPVEIGSYPVSAVIADSNHTGTASGTLVIGKGLASITFEGLATTYDGNPKGVGVATQPAGLDVAVTYDGSTDRPVVAGEYAVAAVIEDDRYEAEASAVLVITPAEAPVILGDLSAIYNGSPKAASAATLPAGLTVSIAYDGQAQPPVAPGSYEVTATVVDDNHTGSASGQMIISPAPAGVSLGGLAATYDGSAKPVAVTTQPPGLAVAVTYDGNAQPPTRAGSYHVVATVTDAGHAGSAEGTLEIARASATVTLDGLQVFHDGTPKAATAITVPAGLSVELSYSGSLLPPSEPGSYAVTATITDPDHTGTASGTLEIDADDVEIELGGLDVIYDGSSKTVAAVTSPVDLPLTITYDGNPEPPVNAGSYIVTATVNAGGYTGSATATLLIRKAQATVSFEDISAEYDSTAKPVYPVTTPAGLPLQINYNGSAAAPAGAGTYTVVATISDPNWTGSASGTVSISPLAATVMIEGLLHDQDGTPKSVSWTTVPSGLPVTVTYDGGALVPAAAGTYVVVATVADGNHQGVASATMVIRPTLQGYRTSVFTPAELADPAISGSDADPDGDGVSNLLEYAFALDPKESDSNGLPTMEIESEHLTLTYIRRRNIADLTFEMETSDDMTHWQSGKDETEVVSVVPLDADREQVTVRDRESTAHHATRYVRIKVAAP